MLNRFSNCQKHLYKELLLGLVVVCLVTPFGLAHGAHWVLTLDSTCAGTSHFGVGETIYLEGELNRVTTLDYACEGLNYIPDGPTLVFADIYLIPDDHEYHMVPNGCYHNLEANSILKITVVISGLGPPWTFGTPNCIALGSVPESGCFDIVIDENQNNTFAASKDLWFGDGPLAAVRVGDYDCDIDINTINSIKGWADDRYHGLRAYLGYLNVGIDLFGIWEDAYAEMIRCNDGSAWEQAGCVMVTVWVRQINEIGLVLQIGSDIIIEELTGIPMTLLQALAFMVVGPPLYASLEYYDMIRQDPPDSNYSEPATLPGYAVKFPKSNDSLEIISIDIANLAFKEAAYLSALLTSLERYQASYLDDELEYKLMHLRNISSYGSWLLDNAARSDTCSLNLENYIRNHDLAVDVNFDSLTSLQQRIETQGLYLEERQDLRRLLASEEQIDSFAQSILHEDWDSLPVGNILDAISTYRSTLADTDSLELFLDKVNEAIGYYEAGGYYDNFPTANAGGSYNGDEGNPITLHGSGSSPNGDVTFSWDIDGDGVFGDLTDSTGEATFLNEGQFIVSLIVADPAGKKAISTATVEVANVYNPPEIISITPEDYQPILWAGESMLFEVIVTDTTIYNWYFDETWIGGGTSIEINSDTVEPGPHLVEVTLFNGYPGCSLSFDWVTMVMAIYVSPDSFSTITVPEGETVIRELTLSNPTDSNLVITIASLDSVENSISWVTAEPDSLLLTAGQDTIIELTFSCEGLNIGNYGGFLETKIADFYGSFNRIPVSISSECSSHIRGDVNGDGVIDIADVVHLLNYLFIGGPAPVPLEAGDATCDGVVDASDVVYLLNYLFVSGPPPGC
jgi:hypothetical protein